MARRAMAALTACSRRLFSVELDGATFCFSVQEKPQEKTAAAAAAAAHLSVLNQRCFSLLVCGGDRIRRARCYSELEAQLAHLSPDCQLDPMWSFVPDVRDSLVKGFFLRDRSENPSSSERFLRDLARRDPLLVCSYLRGEDSQLWTQQLWPDGDNQKTEHNKYCVVPSEAPDYHPSTLNISSDVFYSFEEAYEVLKQSSELMVSVLQSADIIPEATSVLELLPSRAPARSKPDFPVIVIEGLDATGKTTLTESLRDALGATLLLSPPQCLSSLRARFDQEPPLIRRAFYAVGNYITAEQANQAARERPVIVDRFWHSTAAYAMATAVSGPVGNLPAQGSEVFHWPTDLLQPSLVVLLTLDPEERKRRLRDRGQTKTEEEQELDHNRLFRLKVEEAYRRIRGPACVAVDAGPSAEQVLQQVRLLIRAKCHL